MHMRRRVLEAGVTLAAAALAWSGMVGFAHADGVLDHPGRVVEFRTGRPVAADVTAWPGLKSGDPLGKGCPTYGDTPLDAAKSQAESGMFRLRIARSNPTYTITYCAGDAYFPRADLMRKNVVNGSLVEPTPVLLLPHDIDRTTYESLVRDQVTGVLNQLAYLRSAFPEVFDRIVKRDLEEAGPNAAGRTKALIQVRDAVRDWK